MMSFEPPVDSSSGGREHGADDGWVEFSVGAAVGFGWQRFWSNAPVWLCLMVVFALIRVVVDWLGNGFEFETYQAFEWSAVYSLGSIAGSLLAAVVSWLMAAAATRGALDETHGRKATFRGVLELGDVVNVVAVSLLVAVATTVGYLLLVLPGVVVTFLTYYALPFVLDKHMRATTAIRESVALVAANLGRLLLLALAVVAINLVGALLCGIGLLFTIPITLIATTYAFRTIQGERVR